jgi:hypothetical protein
VGLVVVGNDNHEDDDDEQTGDEGAQHNDRGVVIELMIELVM